MSRIRTRKSASKSKVKMAKGSKRRQQAEPAAVDALSTSSEVLRRKPPTEEEVRAALNQVEDPLKIKTKPVKPHGILYYLAVAFAIITGGLLFLLVRDDQFLRKKVPTVMQRLPWQRTGFDRLFAVACSFLGFLIAAVLLDSRGLLRACRKSWRSQRRDFIFAYKEAWRHRRAISFQYLLLFSSIAAAAVAWRMVIAYTSCDAPIVVVLSGSMETAFYRGDLLFLTNDQQDPIIPGEIVVFKIDGRDIPIVHRVMQAHLHDDGKYSYLTKGDNNQGNDRSLYAPGQVWLERHHIVGRARFFLPYVGMITVKLNEYPLLKMVVIVGMLGMMIWSREL